MLSLRGAVLGLWNAAERFGHLLNAPDGRADGGAPPGRTGPRFFGAHPLRKLLTQSAFRSCRKVVAVAQPLAQDCREFLDDDQVVYIPNMFPTHMEGSPNVVLEAMAYGLPRAPGTFLTLVLFGAPAILAQAARVFSIEVSAREVVIIAGAMAMLRLINVAGAVVTNVVLPRLSWVDLNRRGHVLGVVRSLLVLALGAGILTTGAFLVAGDFLLGWWLRRPMEGMGRQTFLLWLSAAPFAVTAVFRPAVDALSPRAYNTRNFAVAVAVAVVALCVGVGAHSAAMAATVAVGILASAITLAVLTVAALWSQLQGRAASTAPARDHAPTGRRDDPGPGLGS